MEKEKEANTIRYILSETDQTRKNMVEDLFKMSPAKQKFIMFSQNRSAYKYMQTSIIENDEKLHIITKQYNLMISSTGTLFVKSGNPIIGLTYNKKGRSNTRLNIWGFNKSIQSIVCNSELELLVNEINPAANNVIKNNLCKQLLTKGMLSSILSGKLNTIDDVMKYRITYGLRGLGLKKNDSESLYYFYNQFKQKYISELILNTCLNPKALLDLFDPISQNFELKARVVRDINTYKNHVDVGIFAKIDKINWAGIDFNASAFFERISKKEKGIKEMLQLWDRGPVLKQKAGPINNIWGYDAKSLPF